MARCLLFVRGFYAAGSTADAVDCYYALQRIFDSNRVDIQYDTGVVTLSTDCFKLLYAGECCYKQLVSKCKEMTVLIEGKCWRRESIAEEHSPVKIILKDNSFAVLLVRQDKTRVKLVIINLNRIDKNSIESLIDMVKRKEAYISFTRSIQLFPLKESINICKKLVKLDRIEDFLQG